MKTLRTLAATAAFALAAAAAGSASAAQIVLNSGMFKRSPGANATAGYLVDDQAGAVAAGNLEWTPGNFGYLIIDLGVASDFSFFEVFTKRAGVTLSVVGGNDLRYDGFNYYLNGATSFAAGALTADAGPKLSAQRFVAESDRSVRYLQIGLGGVSDRAITEFRAYDGDTAVPEPATWALMISGFGMAGAALRRRRLAAA